MSIREAEERLKRIMRVIPSHTMSDKAEAIRNRGLSVHEASDAELARRVAVADLALARGHDVPLAQRAAMRARAEIEHRLWSADCTV